jgi:hypothetical protein
MNQNDHLSFESCHAEFCIIPADIVTQIREVCSGNGDLHFLAPKNPTINLYAEKCWKSYQLNLGNPKDEPDYPLLREFLEARGYSADDSKSLCKYLVEWKDHDIEIDGPIETAVEKIRRSLDKPILDEEQEHWLDNGYESTLSLAYQFLQSLSLDDGKPLEGQSLGCVSFIEGDRPGSDLTYVEIESLATLLALQYRLNELKAGAKIIIA